MTAAPTPANVLAKLEVGEGHTWDTARVIADGQIAALAAAGYAVVPRIPTNAMVRAAVDRVVNFVPAVGLLYGAVYRAMIAEAEKHNGR